jgi:hypothetical protein
MWISVARWDPSGCATDVTPTNELSVTSASVAGAREYTSSGVEIETMTSPVDVVTVRDVSDMLLSVPRTGVRLDVSADELAVEELAVVVESIVVDDEDVSGLEQAASAPATSNSVGNLVPIIFHLREWGFGCVDREPDPLACMGWTRNRGGGDCLVD